MTRITLAGFIAIFACNMIAAELPIIAHWSFDHDQGKTFLLDSSKNKINIPLVPAGSEERIKTVNGVIGQALELTGKEKAVLQTKDKKLNLKVPFSIACWIKIHNDQQANNSILVNASDTGKEGYRLFVAWRMLYYRWGDGNKINSVSTKYGTVVRDKWYHLTITNNGQEIRIYVNGSLINSAQSDNLQQVENPSLYCIGNYFGYEKLRFKGLIDELYIFGKALSEDEVFELAAKQETDTLNKK